MPKPQKDPDSAIYFTATRLDHPLPEGVSTKLAVGKTSEPLAATWKPSRKCFQAQQQTLYSQRNEANTRNVAVVVAFSPDTSSVAIGDAVISTQAYQNLDFTFRRAAKEAGQPPAPAGPAAAAIASRHSGVGVGGVGGVGDGGGGGRGVAGDFDENDDGEEVHIDGGAGDLTGADNLAGDFDENGDGEEVTSMPASASTAPAAAAPAPAASSSRRSCPAAGGGGGNGDEAEE